MSERTCPVCEWAMSDCSCKAPSDEALRDQQGEITMNTERLAKLDTIALSYGSHKAPDAGMCAMEAVAWLAGEPHSDAPACACPIITRAMIRLNDRMPESLRTELLRPLLPRIIGTRASREVMIKRGYVAADMAVRVFAPMALEARGRLDFAAKLRELAPIVDRETAEKGRSAAAAYAYAYDAASAAASAAASQRAVYVEAVRMIERMIEVVA
jgi:hypothetical protein